ncbi:MAG: helix-turn-helix domain-containing protein [Bacteroidota bacterium]
MNEHPFHIATITELHQLAGIAAPQHPLISLVRIEDLPTLPKGYPSRFTYGFYSIGLKKNLKGYVEYGRKQYDFQKGVMAFTAPNQLISYANSDASEANGWLIFFDPFLLRSTVLKHKIQDFGFFDYETYEALHISQGEEDQIQEVFKNINREYILPIDSFSKEVMLANLDLLLTYSKRFYTRQFITRNDTDDTLYQKFLKDLDNCFKDTNPTREKIPDVRYFSERLGVSSRYLSDSLKSISGKSTKEHIDFKIVQIAKQLLISSNLSIAEIAYEIGFEYPQYFSRFFKKSVGVTPTEFKSKRSRY